MGLFSFLKGIGKKVMPGREAEEITNDITESLGGQVKDLTVSFDDGTVSLGGTVATGSVREKAILLAGNVEGVERVEDSIVVEADQPVFYTVESGDSLSKIALAQYGDAMKWEALFEANREVIKDPDLIYPGQQIRIPKMG